MAPEMELTGAQHMSQTPAMRGEVEEGGCPTDEEQKLKVSIDWCEPVEKRGEPGNRNRLDRVTEVCPEDDTLSPMAGIVQTPPCGCSRKHCVPGSSFGTGFGSNNQLTKSVSWQVLVTAIVTALIIIAMLTTFLVVIISKTSLVAPTSPPGPCCPAGWIGYSGKCYYFSETEGNWTYSQSQCSSLNASLAVIDSEQEKVFLLRYKGFLDRWIGLIREPGQPWRWPNGTLFDFPFPIRGGGDCAYLMEDNQVSSSRCSTERHWICTKPDTQTTGKGHYMQSQIWDYSVF